MIKKLISIVCLVFCITYNHLSQAQDSLMAVSDVSINKHIDGTLIIPNVDNGPTPLAIIIAGSGPTDRDGNQNLMQNNSLKKLAVALAEKNIASFRYDKRVVKQLKSRNIDPNTTFDNFVTDANAVLTHFQNKKDFSKVYIIGHSQGSLVGMLAATNNADGFISIAGAGQSIDNVIISQIAAMDSTLLEGTKKAFESLRAGETTSDYPMALGSIFRADVQPFIMNWMKYNPTLEISKLNIPILIVNGTKDLQVSEDEASLLKNASKNAELKIIENMNHVLFIIDGNELENSKSYNEPSREISKELIETISSFILAN